MRTLIARKIIAFGLTFVATFEVHGRFHWCLRVRIGKTNLWGIKTLSAYATLKCRCPVSVTVHGLFYEPSRASNYDFVDDAFAGGSVSESCELSGEGDDSV
jgi:hypothetical protein